jgi:hypothetical protein
MTRILMVRLGDLITHDDTGGQNTHGDAGWPGY